MGFLEEIINNLNSNAKTQQDQLLTKYKEHSYWLQSELETIKNLIHQNPRDHFHSSAKEGSTNEKKCVEDIDEIPAPTSVPERSNGQKRKSPEVRLGMTKESPEQKRCSVGVDWEDVASNVGLPFDLNKLKKEQLIIELENCGVDSFTMKDLKKDMIDALKDKLTTQFRNSSAANADISQVNDYQNALVQNNQNDTNKGSPTESMESPIKAGEVNQVCENSDMKQQPSPESDQATSSPSEEIVVEEDAIPVDDVVNTINTKQENEDELEVASDYDQSETAEDGQSQESELKYESPQTIITNSVETIDSAPSSAMKSENKSNVVVSSKDEEQISKVPIISNNTQKLPPKNLALSSNVTTFIPTSQVQPKVVTKPIIPSLEKARVLREAEEAKERARAMKAAEDLKQKKLNEQSTSNSGKQPTTWDRLVKPATKPVSSVTQQLPTSKPSNLTSVTQGATKKGLMETIFGAKKTVPAVSGASNAVQVQENLEVKSGREVQEPLPEQIKINSTQSVDNNVKPVEIQKHSPTESTVDIKSQNVLQPVEPLRSIPVAEEVCDEYQIEDRDSTGSSDSGTDDEEDRKEKQKKIPEWARGNLLKEALDRQYGLSGNKPMDPDAIFPEVQTCSLEEIFGKQQGKSGMYSKRTSSAHWDHDQLSLIEKRTYRTQMGYGGI